MSIQTVIKPKSRAFTLNFGPQHPASHGVLRIILTMQGELITNLDTHIGLLHRGTEKLIEYKTALQALPYFDRLDYVSVMAMEHTFCLAIEQLTQMTVSQRSKLIWMLYAELTRILNHLLAISCFAMDTGALTPFLFAFEQWELLMEFYEWVSGAWMHSAYFRPGGVSCDMPVNLLESIHLWSTHFADAIDEMEELLTSNRIFKQRLVDIGVLPTEMALLYGASGVLLRGCGIPYDVWKVQPYEYYDMIDFDVPIGVNSDCYDRFLLRIEEMRQSLRIIKQTIDLISHSSKLIPHLDIHNAHTSISWTNLKHDMEQLIMHFKTFTSGFTIPCGEVYCSTEAPKGEFGVVAVGNGSNRCYRIKIKSPDYASLQSIQHISKHHYLADLVTIIGSLDIVFGSIDR